MEGEPGLVLVLYVRILEWNGMGPGFTSVKPAQNMPD